MELDDGAYTHIECICLEKAQVMSLIKTSQHGMKEKKDGCCVSQQK